MASRAPCTVGAGCPSEAAGEAGKTGLAGEGGRAPDRQGESRRARSRVRVNTKGRLGTRQARMQTGGRRGSERRGRRQGAALPAPLLEKQNPFSRENRRSTSVGPVPEQTRRHAPGRKDRGPLPAAGADCGPRAGASGRESQS